jgi:outer membrane protein W
MPTLRTCHRFALPVLFLVALTGVASPAAAQAVNSGKWEVEFHGGGVLPTNSARGTVSLPAAGQTFTTSGIFPPPAPQVLAVSSSRRESSWYFGDGAVLFNQMAAAIAASTVAATPPFSGRITTLDPVLGRSLGEGRRGGDVGARVRRVLTPRLSAELSVDYSLARIQISQANRDAIDATRSSFVAAFNGLITGNPSRVLKNLTSTAVLEKGSAHQLFSSGALIIHLRTIGDVTPYATVGAGVISTVGKMPTATLTGNYQFLNPSGSPIDETDTVTVRAERDDWKAAGVVGGGLKYQATPHWGIRIDARVSLSRNNSNTSLDATPNVSLGQLPAGRGLVNADPTIQFSNSSEPVTTLGVTSVAASTLTGPAISGLRTWSGRGVSSHSNITVGAFWRF